jgi:hypothetical protein
MDDLGMRIDPMGLEDDELSFCAAVLPAQFYSFRRGSASVEPIMRLMAGILIDAVRCFQRNFKAHRPSRRQEFREAQFWIFDDNENGPFSFQCVCDSLEIDPCRLRDWITRWQKDKFYGDKRMTRRSPVNNAMLTRSQGGRPKKPSNSGLGMRKAATTTRGVNATLHLFPVAHKTRD